MRAVVWVPFRGDGALRDRLWDRVRAQIETLPIELLIADSGDEPFSIARTWNLLAARSGEWDRAVMWGADFLLAPAESIIDALHHPGDLVFGFDRAQRLTKGETLRALRGHPIPARADRLPPGGPRVISRNLWEAVRGYDPRFLGWGHEDRVFFHSAHVFGFRAQRVRGRMLNLWHPRRRELAGTPFYELQKRNLSMWHELREVTDPGELTERIDEIRRAHASS